MKYEDLTGKRFNNLTVIERVKRADSKQTYWRCKCDCGNETITTSAHLKSGHTKSCGCLQKETTSKAKKTHGKTLTPLYRVYRGIIDRTLYPSNKRYMLYGGRGIRICDEWLNDFQTFYDWAMSHGYKKGLSIDRIDPNGNYEPANCRWATWTEQQNNRRNNRLITYNGETHTIAEWSRITGIKYSTLRMRLDVRKWDIERALHYVQKL